MTDTYEKPSLTLEDVITKYRLPSLAGDFIQMEDGNLLTTKDGDLVIGTNVQNSLRRFCEPWRYSTDTLGLLFGFVAQCVKDQERLRARVNELTVPIVRGQISVDVFHGLQDALGARSYARDAYAGAIAVVLNNLLGRLEDDLEKPKDWRTAGTLVEGQSFGAIVKSAAANFRHYDEWAKTDPPTNNQLRSIRVIAKVLQKQLKEDGSRHPFRTNVCPQVIEVLSGGDYETLNERLFSYVRSLAGV